MERKYFKALNFDLDTHQLKEHYPGANYRQAYGDLRRFFKRHRFSHRQGSGYISDDKPTSAARLTQTPKQVAWSLILQRGVSLSG